MKRLITGLPNLLHYLQTVKPMRLLLDVFAVSFVLFVFGIVTDKIPIAQLYTIPDWVFVSSAFMVILSYLFALGVITFTPKKRTVEETCQISEQIESILSGELYNSDHRFMGLFVYHNGQHSLHDFSFMKFSLIGSAQTIDTHVPIQELQSLPITVNLPLVAATVNGESFSGHVTPSSPVYSIVSKMGIKSYTTSPVYTHRGALAGFIYVGSKTDIAPNKEYTESIAEKLSPFI